MTVAAPSAAPAETAAPATRSRWRTWALAAICAAAAVLYAWRIGDGQVGNSYYSAAVKSMTGSFSNFLFGSFDPYGVFTVDKPPMSLWPQAISVLIFGFHGWALLLPQVLEGVAAVFLLHRAVRLWAGENAALLAALILTLTPITVAINRDNNPDTLLVLLLVAAAYAFTRSVQADPSRARTRWLLWCAFFIGCGFVTKMMQAWIILPGFALAYFAGTSAPVKRRLLDLLGAAAVLLVSSFWWTALHDLWPGSKPYMGGSTDGTALNLIFGYNGFGRIFGGEGNFGPGGGGHRPGGGLPGGMELPAGTAPPSGGPGGMFGGETGLGRMFGGAVGGQISWLLPLALLVLVAVAVRGVRRKRPGGPAQRAGWFAWGSWLLVTGVVFSYAQGIWHPYYTTMLAPAIAAICAAGLAGFWREYRQDSGYGWLLLPAGVALTAGWAFVLANRDPSWHGWTRWAVLAVGAVAVAALVLGKLASVRRAIFTRASLVLAAVALLLVPAVWSAATAATGESMGGMPSAGPAGLGFPGGSGGGARMPGGRDAGLPGAPDASGFPGGPGGMRAGARKPGDMGDFLNGKLTDDQRRILDYAKQHSGGAAITLAVDGSATMASSFIIGSDETVIGMGGFLGSDDSPSVGQLQQWTAEGKLKFVLGSTGGRGGRGMPGMSGGAGEKRQGWIKQHCAAVDPAAYGGKPASAEQEAQAGPMGGAQTLYQCHA
ncbi:phospholipid carrier-dependent glycosyltransferase [Amycolatopsis rubida]|uniref:Phospholipid carrier-dependent glycosyltransferase n=1 Tax=Amycolatopsis rubida TaxID=112413 RepID=A0ABX0BHA5_9PSEU|nr:glycosyltransferase family 39 protein [Amycolatopsis rubida]MYW89720.1 phospholipid carrier-dependent glycosyltransferase [Amycolatopsis rubida]NEC54696.1 phospholipid carrier-dependent glycosyltransferase [Amycolatopsis rubida]